MSSRISSYLCVASKLPAVRWSVSDVLQTMRPRCSWVRAGAQKKISWILEDVFVTESRLSPFASLGENWKVRWIPSDKRKVMITSSLEKNENVNHVILGCKLGGDVSLGVSCLMQVDCWEFHSEMRHKPHKRIEMLGKHREQYRVCKSCK